MKSYIIGFISALALTLVAYLFVVNHWATGDVLIWIIMGLAALQVVVQLVFFLHLGREQKPQWNGAAFYFMLIVLVIIVAGSLWIMYHLNYNMGMDPKQMEEYMLKQSSKGF